MKLSKSMIYLYILTMQKRQRILRTFIEFNENLKWVSGPESISDDISSWPKYELLSVPSDVITTLVHAQMTRIIEEELITVKNFSDTNKLRRVMSYVFKFCFKLTKSR